MPNELLIPNKGSSSIVTTKIRIDGNVVPDTVEVLSIVVVKEANRIPFAKLEIADGVPAAGDFPASSGNLFVPGKKIEILVGYDANEDLVFKGVIVKHGLKVRQTGSFMLRLDCRDEAFKTTLGRKCKYFTEVKDSEAIEDILANYSDLQPDIEVSDVQHKNLVQFESTDWDFIQARAEANGKLCICDNGKISVKKPDFSSQPVLTLLFGATILEFDAEIDARNQFSAVKSYSWDYTAQELIETEAVEPAGFPIAGNIDAADLAAVGGLDSFSLKHSGQIPQDELQAWADAQLLRTRLAKIRGQVKFSGFAPIIPGTLVKLQGLGDRFNGTVFVAGVRQDIGGGDWSTSVQFGLSEDWLCAQPARQSVPASSLVPPVHGLQIGVVTQLKDDPDGEHRILVKMPVISPADDGVWARVSTLDAGNNRGSFFLPEIGDEVIVGFIHGDPRDPVVLGMLNSSAKPAPILASDDNFEKGFVTKSDIKLLFNDDKKTVLISTPAGKKILLDEDKGVIQLEDENGNKIVLDSSGITIESSGDLILKAAGDLKAEGKKDTQIKAGASFKAEGSAGAEMSTSAVAVLKGSLVQIN